jgi:hypothetical protein
MSKEEIKTDLSLQQAIDRLFTDRPEIKSISMTSNNNEIVEYRRGQRNTVVWRDPLMILFEELLIRQSLRRVFLNIIDRQQDINNEESSPLDSQIKDSLVTRLCTENSEESCGICMEKYITGKVITYLPCKHFFHKDCIDEWFKIKSSCPLCRDELNIN